MSTEAWDKTGHDGESKGDMEKRNKPIELLLRVINEKNLSSQQIYNADESELFRQMLPDKKLADLNEKVAPGRKVIKARITFMTCANVTGKHKLPIFVVVNATKTLGFKSVTLPVCYRGQKNAWVTRELFLDWFKTEFVPAVRQHMKSVNLPQRAVLLLDNCTEN
ncbi:hypothetical protein J437_LFUL018517 [Ladona fulva]|uniref:DDE-1 domain-containing protein n=1 Tax=Ladona fulva TaxID=123851 RepID=A0A8K0KRJ1_LADFU|nr:hypothetical protein J437_LFUL018517 [Ladona fulva]